MDTFTLFRCIGEIDDRYILSAQRALGLQPPRPISLKRYLVLAAAILLALALVGCAIWLGLGQLKVGEQEIAGETRDVISLQGFADSPSGRAAARWQQFLQSYDPDGALLAQADTDDWQEPMDYMSYTCYTPELQTEIDAICAEYGLALLGPTYLPDYAWQIFDAVGIRGITADDAAVAAELYPGYYYQEGSFSLGGTVTLLDEETPWPHPVPFQYRCIQKGSFDGVHLAVGEIENYREWEHTLPDGSRVLLALSAEKALIIADRADFFATVYIMAAGTEAQGRHMDPAALEAVADVFTFVYQPRQPDPDKLTAPEWFE